MPSRASPRRAAIISTYGYVDTVSVLCDTAELLAQRGYEVDLIVDEWPGFNRPRFSSPMVKLLPVRRAHRADTHDGWRGRLSRLRTTLEMGVRYLNLDTPWGRAGRAPYDFVIGVDSDGLTRASLVALLSPARTVYYSLELLLGSEVRARRDHARKRVERYLSRRASLVIIQDLDRADLLQRDNSIDARRIVLVPNAPIGPGQRSSDRYWHELFGLAPEARILLYAGSLAAWTGVHEVIAACANLPDPWRLVIHSRYDPEATQIDSVGRSGVEALKEGSSPSKVLFSTSPVPRQELPRLIESADAGVAFYTPGGDSVFTQGNIAVIGLSSGKVSSYLAAGLPVIVNSATTLAGLVSAEGIGVTVEDAAGIPSAIEAIDADYGRYADNAVAFFDRHLDFDKSFARLWARLDSLTRD